MVLWIQGFLGFKSCGLGLRWLSVTGMVEGFGIQCLVVRPLSGIHNYKGLGGYTNVLFGSSSITDSRCKYGT